MLGIPRPRQGHAPDVTAGTAAGTGRSAEQFRAFAKGIQMPPDPKLGVVVTDHLRMRASGHGTFEFSPNSEVAR